MAKTDQTPPGLRQTQGDDSDAARLDVLKRRLWQALNQNGDAQALLAARIGNAAQLKLADLVPLADQGLAHDHLRIGASGLVARLPKQSQWQQEPEANLRYQAACFARLATSGDTPACHGLLPVSESLPFGGLLVDFIEGRRADAAQDMPAIALCLARIHTSPEPKARSFDPGGVPLADQSQVIRANLPEIDRQLAFIDRYPLTQEARGLLLALRQDLQQGLRQGQARAGQDGADRNAGKLPRYPIANDTHPGNYRLQAGAFGQPSRAILVDLEKAALGNPGIDLAHASAYTSTTWEPQGAAALDVEQITAFYETYLAAVPLEMAATLRPWLLLTRRLLYMRALSWCLMWLSEQDNPDSGWARSRSDSALVAHFRARARHFLQGQTLQAIRQELAALHESLCP